MISFKASDLHRQARQQLQQATAPKRLVLIHASIALGSTLLLAVLNFLFSLLIDDTGGLSGMGTRSLLSTAQTLMETVVMMALPFWQIGLTFLALRWARNDSVQTGHLLQGFRRFGPVFAFRLLYGFVFLSLGFAAIHLASVIILMTPFSEALVDALSPMMDPSATAEQIEALFSPEKLSGMLDAAIPLFVVFGIIFLIAAIPVFYRLRPGEAAVMDGLGSGGALLHSLRITKGSWRHLVKLDLHFWWFYVLQVLCNLIANGNLLLPLLGISLPMGKEAAYFLFFGLGTALQILILWQFQGQVLTSYAVVYDTLSPPQAQPQ